MNSTSISQSIAITQSQQLGTNGVEEVTFLQLSALIVPLILVFLISYRIQLGIGKQLFVAAIRCFIQLNALGFILVPIIKYNNPLVVIFYLFLMMCLAGIEASIRTPYVFDELVLVCIFSIAVTVSSFAIFTFNTVLSTGLNAQYVIPIVGIMAGNAMNAVSVAVSSIVTNLAEHKHDVELLLALGATRWEACMHVIKSSVKLGLTPLLNTMSVSGLVAIPGMMTGQIIGGTAPALAAKYQMVIIYAAGGSVTISTLLASLLTVRALVDREQRIRSEKLVHRDSISRIDSATATIRYLASKCWLCRPQSLQTRSFSSHVHSPLSSTPPQQVLSKSESEKGTKVYGSI